MVWLSECEVGRPFSHVVFCSDATLRRFCVQCTTASFKELKEPRDFVNGGVLEHEESPISCQFVTPMNQRNAMSLVKPQTVAELQTLKMCRLRMALGSTAKVCVLAELLCGLPVLKHWRLSSVLGPFAVFLLHGAILLAGSRSSKATSSSRKQFT